MSAWGRSWGSAWGAAWGRTSEQSKAVGGWKLPDRQAEQRRRRDDEETLILITSFIAVIEGHK